ncbi:MAG: hypothetical protein QNK26_01115 [Moritella sp.]|uniref:hypothetical protein n=1 Tax=Moritella sp. TaxID=78556 RepID=UPI0029BA08FA|nr:hypothetical protein [Moritella sp.]MDX2319181.1 hypothetical protein [Moritella sp.]
MKAITVHRPTLKIIWKLLVILFFPLTIWLYSVISDTPFSTIDSGANYHKWIIFFLYLGCLAIWLYLDSALSNRSFFRS